MNTLEKIRTVLTSLDVLERDLRKQTPKITESKYKDAFENILGELECDYENTKNEIEGTKEDGFTIDAYMLECKLRYVGYYYNMLKDYVKDIKEEVESEE